MVFPDTSPRGTDAEAVSDSGSIGLGAGFYVNATTDKFKKNFQMYTYITKELPDIV